MGNYKAWKKALGFVFIGIAIALIFTLTDTYSLYQNKGEGDGQVIAASREDIVKNIEIIYEDHIPILRLEKGNGVDYSPIIFFSLEGELEDYVLHINSVKLDGIEETPIVPNVNLPQAMSLLIGPKEELTGTLRIKHLNEFIDEAIDISLSKEYLLSRYFYDRGLENYSKDYLSYKEKGELIDLIKGSLFYAEKYLEWERVE